MQFAWFLQYKNIMKKTISLLGLFLVFSLIMITSQASAESKVSGTSPISFGEFFRDWHDWSHKIVNKPFYLHLNDSFIGKLTLFRDNRLEISAPVSDTMTSRFTLGNRGVTVLHDSGHPNLALGITTRMRNGLSFDSSVNFDLNDPSDVTFLLTLPAIRF